MGVFTMPQESPKPLLTPDEFRAALGNTIGRASINELLKTGRIKHVTIGRRLLIPRSEVETFVQREVEDSAERA